MRCMKAESITDSRNIKMGKNVKRIYGAKF